MKKLFRIIGITSLVGIIGLGLSACGHHHHSPEDRAEWIVKKMTRKLDLNDDQQAKLQAVANEFLLHHREHREKKQQYMDMLLSEIKKPEMDKSVLISMLDEHQQHISTMAPQVIDKFIVFHASLNDEQKEELAAKIERFKKHHTEDDD